MASAYVGQFSTDSSFYYTCCQGWCLRMQLSTLSDAPPDWKLHVYDTTVAPKLRGPKTTAQTPHSDHDTTMSVIKDITAAEGGWTITDSHLSPDNERYFPWLMLRVPC
jgi:WD repeat-containing protein 23